MKPEQFLKVATMLANGNDPERLAVVLASWARPIGRQRVDDDEDDRAMLMAARILEEKLPYYVTDHLPGLSTPDYIDQVLDALPELIEFLKAQVRPPREGNRPPDSRRRVCAAVCAEAWHHYHGEAQPFSSKLQEACEVYWQRCGNPETGDSGSIRNWERHLRWAKDESDEEFREDFIRCLEE
jgi:hypothetical protein